MVVAQPFFAAAPAAAAQIQIAAAGAFAALLVLTNRIPETAHTFSGWDATADTDVAAKFALALSSLGNVRTRTARAWTEAEMQKLISELP